MRIRWMLPGAVLALVATAGAALASGGTPGFAAYGQARYVDAFRFAVVANPHLGEVKGFLFVQNMVPSATATCMTVSGDAVTTGWRVTSGPNAGQGFEAAVEAGTPTSSPVGRVLWFQFVASPPTVCVAPSMPPPTAILGGPISDGHIFVGPRSAH